MVKVIWASTIVAGGVIAAGISTGVTAWADGPGGYVEDTSQISEAVGTGVFDGALAGFRATGTTNDEASARVVAACEAAGGQACTSDEVTNDDLCILSLADNTNSVVAGGAGATIEAARGDAVARAAANGTPLSPAATIVISACP
ncbi:hypothetical protein [Mycobacterium sp. AT1]|uniref:hypothetical protein n=1 Tax=Mycobacterium sp. AT1 TaxID=1961706 RepID=UPI0009AC0EDF|nr:hypothetical protein [Mycobacterium sp. AT1]OPX08451.1 hypothetical protein B1790_19320 [Mycobacterium sp. AT1]